MEGSAVPCGPSASRQWKYYTSKRTVREGKCYNILLKPSKINLNESVAKKALLSLLFFFLEKKN